MGPLYVNASHHVLWRGNIPHVTHARHPLGKLLLNGIQGARSWLKIAVHRVVCQVQLCAADVDRHKATDEAGHHPVFVKNDAGGNDEASIREVPCVVNGENPTGILVRHTHVILPLLETLRTLKTIVWPVRFAAIASLQAKI